MKKARIVHARLNEKGTTTGGKVGDQNGREIMVSENTRTDWNVVLVPPNPRVADQMVDLAIQIANNNNYGYSQSDRLSMYRAVSSQGVASGSGDCDCSSFISGVALLCGASVRHDATTRNMRTEFKQAGWTVSTDTLLLQDATYARKGMIYLAEGKHTAMAIENGGNVGSAPVWLIARTKAILWDLSGMNKIAEISAGEGVTCNVDLSNPDYLHVKWHDQVGLASTSSFDCPLLWRVARYDADIYTDKGCSKKIGTVKQGQGATINNLFCSEIYTRCNVGGVNGYVRAGVF